MIKFYPYKHTEIQVHIHVFPPFFQFKRISCSIFIYKACQYVNPKIVLELNLAKNMKVVNSIKIVYLDDQAIALTIYTLEKNSACNLQ